MSPLGYWSVQWRCPGSPQRWRCSQVILPRDRYRPVCCCLASCRGYTSPSVNFRAELRGFARHCVDTVCYFHLRHSGSFISPCQRHFQFGFVVNLLIDTATQFGHIHRPDFHSQPIQRSCDQRWNRRYPSKRRPATDSFTFHAGDGQTGAGKAQQFFFNIGRNRCVIGILNVMTVNGECRDAFLAVSCQSRCRKQRRDVQCR